MLWYLFAIFLPFLAVAFKTKKLAPSLIALGLTLLGWIPGAIYGVFVIHKYAKDEVGEDEVAGV